MLKFEQFTYTDWHHFSEACKATSRQQVLKNLVLSPILHVHTSKGWRCGYEEVVKARCVASPGGYCCWEAQHLLQRDLLSTPAVTLGKKKKELEFIYALLDLLIRSKFDLNSFTHRELVNIEVGTILYSNNYSATVLPDFHRSSSCIPHHWKSKIKVLVKFYLNLISPPLKTVKQVSKLLTPSLWRGPPDLLLFHSNVCCYCQGRKWTSTASLQLYQTVPQTLLHILDELHYYLEW